MSFFKREFLTKIHIVTDSDEDPGSVDTCCCLIFYSINDRFVLFQAYLKACDVAGIGAAFPASERDVSEEQQVVLVRAVGA